MLKPLLSICNTYTQRLICAQLWIFTQTFMSVQEKQRRCTKSACYCSQLCAESEFAVDKRGEKALENSRDECFKK